LVFGPAAGGMAPSLARALEGVSASWIACAMSETEREAARSGLPVRANGGVAVRLLEVPPETLAAAYRVVANSTLWFLFHGMFDRVYRPLFDRYFFGAWQGYRDYNAAFAEAIAGEAAPGATVVVNDYHLFLVGPALAARRPDLRTIHFTHIPFCSPDELRTLPSEVARELMGAMASYGTVGFHTERWAEQYRACSESVGVHPAAPVVVPLGVDAPEIRTLAEGPAVAARRDELMSHLEGRRYVFRSDRIEPSKNVVRGFLAFEALLDEEPGLVEAVVFGTRLYTSREDLPEYRAYRSAIEATVERINAKFANKGVAPIELEVADDHEASLAALSVADVLLVNPLRDGMNLVAKEGPTVSRRAGVLTLSTEAGAFAELGSEALPVEPFDIAGTAAVLRRALAMPLDERTARAGRLAELAAKHPPAEWLADVVAAAGPSSAR
jgi:trehalose 6-phosphate synthase